MEMELGLLLKVQGYVLLARSHLVEMEMKLELLLKV
jgi:hypothetical protein